MSEALARQSGIEHVDLEQTEIPPEAAARVPEDLARWVGCVPLSVDGETIIVAMHNPADIVAIDEIQRHAERFVTVACASQRQILTQAQRAAPDGPEVRLNLGIANDQVGDHECAVYHYQRFLLLARTDDSGREAVDLRIQELSGLPVRSHASDAPPPAAGDPAEEPAAATTTVATDTILE